MLVDLKDPANKKGACLKQDPYAFWWLCHLCKQSLHMGTSEVQAAQ